MIISKKIFVALGAVASIGVGANAMASTQTYSVSISCPGQPKIIEQIGAGTQSQAIQVMKKRYPGCMVYVESPPKRVSPTTR